MANLSNWTKLTKAFTLSWPKNNWPWLLAMVLIGLSLRLWKFGHYPFGFDQIQILEAANRILQLDPMLIGPRTGPAAMFTGPLIYYVAAAWRLILGEGGTLVATSASLAGLTGVVIYALSNRYVNRSLANWAILFWAVSPFLVLMDRVTWNPNFTLLAASLCFWPWLDQNKRPFWEKAVLIGLGSFLGYQAHFSGLLLPGLVSLMWLLKLELKKFWLVAAAWLGLTASLLPTVLFDYRNNWLNARGFIALFQGKPDGGMSLSVSFWKNIYILLETWGKLIWQYQNAVLSTFFGLILAIAALALVWQFRHKSSKKSASEVIQIAVMWLIGIAVSFSLYRLNKPEYYFVIAVPAFIYVLWQVIDFYFNNKQKIVIATLFFSYSLLINQANLKEGPSLNLQNQFALAKKAQEIAHRQPVGPLIFDLSDVDSLGLRYLIGEWPTQPQAQSIHVIYPYQHETLGNYQIEDLALWIDPRLTASTNLHLADLLITLPSENQIFQELATYEPEPQAHTYSVQTSSSLDQIRQLGRFIYVPRKQANPRYQFWQQTLADSQNPVGSWKFHQDHANYYGIVLDTCILLWEENPNSSRSKNDLETWLDSVGISWSRPEKI